MYKNLFTNFVVLIVCFLSEHFENDVKNTVKSFLAFHPAINVIVVSNEFPYPPIDLPAGNTKVFVRRLAFILIFSLRLKVTLLLFEINNKMW